MAILFCKPEEKQWIGFMLSWLTGPAQLMIDTKSSSLRSIALFVRLLLKVFGCPEFKSDLFGGGPACRMNLFGVQYLL